MYEPDITTIVAIDASGISQDTTRLLKQEWDESRTGLTVYPRNENGRTTGWFAYLPCTMAKNGDPVPEPDESMPADLAGYCRSAMRIPGAAAVLLDTSGNPDADALGKPIGMLNASTAHISRETAGYLDGIAGKPGSGPVTVYAKASGRESFGWYVLFDRNAWSKAGMTNPYPGRLPQDLADCCGFAATLTGVSVLCLDRDAGIIPGLPVYEWDEA